MPKIFSFDLDGTLLTSNRIIHHDTLKALHIAKEKGHILVANTGRGMVGVKFLDESYADLFDFYIVNNGTIVYDVKNKKQHFNGKLDTKIIDEIIWDLSLYEPVLFPSTERETYLFKVFAEPEGPRWYREAHEFIEYIAQHRTVYEYEDMKKGIESETFVQLAIRAEKESVGLMYGILKERYDDEFEIAQSGEEFIDINPKGMNKYKGLELLSTIIKFEPKDAYAFGDSGNDLAILQNCNNSYAMEHATYDVKDAAKEVIGNNNTDTIGKKILEIIG